MTSPNRALSRRRSRPLARRRAGVSPFPPRALMSALLVTAALWSTTVASTALASMPVAVPPPLGSVSGGDKRVAVTRLDVLLDATRVAQAGRPARIVETYQLESSVAVPLVLRAPGLLTALLDKHPLATVPPTESLTLTLPPGTHTLVVTRDAKGWIVNERDGRGVPTNGPRLQHRELAGVGERDPGRFAGVFSAGLAQHPHAR